jgi:hypothetical protein
LTKHSFVKESFSKMARTKMEARASVGGKAPRKLLQTKAILKPGPSKQKRIHIIIDLTVEESPKDCKCVV